MRPMLWLLILAIGIGYLTGCRDGKAPAKKAYRLSKVTIKLDREGKYWLDFHDQDGWVFHSFRFLFNADVTEGFGGTGTEWHVRVTQRKVTPNSFDIALQVRMSWEVRLEFDGITDVRI